MYYGNSLNVSKHPTKKYEEEKLHVASLSNVRFYKEKIVDGRRVISFTTYREKMSKTDKYITEKYRYEYPLIVGECYRLQGTVEKPASNHWDDDREFEFNSDKCIFIGCDDIVEKEKYIHTIYRFEEIEETTEISLRKLLNKINDSIEENKKSVEDRLSNLEETCSAIYAHLGCGNRKRDYDW